MKKIVGLLIMVLILSSVTYNVYAKSETFEVVNFSSDNFQMSREQIGQFNNIGSEILQGYKCQSTLSEEFRVGDLVNPLSILDDRGLIFLSNVEPAPFCQIVKVKTYYDSDGDGVANYISEPTGFMVGPGIVLTAAHCVYKPDMHTVSVGVYVKPNGYTNYLAYHIADSWTISSEYYNDPNNLNSDYDWAIITMKENISAKTGWMGIGYSVEDIKDKQITVSGYPGDEKYIGHQCCSTGVMNSISEYRVQHTANTLPGHSGSPIFNSDGVAWAIHTHGGGQYNYGTRFDINLYGLLKQKIYNDICKYYD
ncbi:MAG: trypsin-like serine protease [Lachnospiraceae bacterium]|nr:trypsin-like serine protease [Lachnospiraceae bacterium]